MSASTDNDLKLLRQVLNERSVPAVVPESFTSNDTLMLYDDLLRIRNTVLQFSLGNFDAEVTGKNVLTGALKTLQAHLRHLAWQVGEVAKGDFAQRVDFMGEFSFSFNSMVAQLERSLNDLKSSEERWNLAVQCSRDGIVDVNIDERTAWYSDSFMQMLHYSPKDIPQDLHWETLIHPDDGDSVGVLREVFEGTGEKLPFATECRLQTGLGHYLWVQIRGMPVRSGNVRRLICVVADISAKKATEETLILQAMYDNLTGLPNRYLLDDRLKQVVARSERSGQPFIITTLDLDFVKEVNDTYGHATGDLVLVELARRLRMGLRSMDTAARIGGDEFVAIYPCESDTERATAETVMKRLYHNLKPPIMLENTPYQLRSSVGIAFFPKHTQDVATLFEYADAALYKAKKNGKNQYTIYDPDDNPDPK